jgi:hypothetical protein
VLKHTAGAMEDDSKVGIDKNDSQAVIDKVTSDGTFDEIRQKVGASLARCSRVALDGSSWVLQVVDALKKNARAFSFCRVLTVSSDVGICDGRRH